MLVCFFLAVVVVALVSRGILPHLPTMHVYVCVSLPLCVCVSVCLPCALLCVRAINCYYRRDAACRRLSSRSSSSLALFPSPCPFANTTPPPHQQRQARLRFITFIIIEAYSPFNICRIYLGTLRAAELAFFMLYD